MKKQDATTETTMMSWLRDCMKHPNLQPSMNAILAYYALGQFVQTVSGMTVRHAPLHSAMPGRALRGSPMGDGGVGTVQDGSRRLISEAIREQLGNACHTVAGRVDGTRPDHTMKRVPPGTST
jgi:hypothetical protein